MIQPETQYTTVGDDRVAYQVLGQGRRDLLLTAGFWSHLDIPWENGAVARFLRRLGSFTRLIRFDRRGTGLSDHLSDDASIINSWLDDCEAVLEANDSTSPILMGATSADAGPLVLQLADRLGTRCSGLILANTTACFGARADYPEGLSPESMEQLKDVFRKTWGQSEFSAQLAASQDKNSVSMSWFAKWQRSMATPRAIVENLDMHAQLDSRPLLPRIRVPTLVLGRANYRLIPVAQTAYMARRISGARYVELPGSDGSLYWESADQILDLIEEFVTGHHGVESAERAMAAILFVDIVDSTRRAAAVGNATWRDLLDQHDSVVREQVAAHAGRFVESAGDGTLSTFTNPGGAIDCARAVQAALLSLGLPSRAGLHFGEVELRDDGRVGGMAVHVAARVQALAGAGEILVSHVVQGALLGSRYSFEERGIHELKGVPGKWPVFVVEAATGSRLS